MAASRSINELQYAFGSSLTDSEKVDSVTGFTTLPRELRDKIYYHFLHSPEGVVYRPKTVHDSCINKHSEARTSLFLTCRQVHVEAVKVFHRHSTVQIASTIQRRYHTYYPKALQASLDLFPDTHARFLQRLSISLHNYKYFFYPLPNEVPSLGTGAAFLQMVRDACIFKAKFHRLREFTIIFGMDLDYLTTDKFDIQGRDDDEKMVNCGQMMREWLADDDVVPPIWLNFCFDEHWLHDDLCTLQYVWNESYASVVRERAGRREGIMESGSEPSEAAEANVVRLGHTQ